MRMFMQFLRVLNRMDDRILMIEKERNNYE